MKTVAQQDFTGAVWGAAAQLLPLRQKVALGLQDAVPGELAAKTKAAILHIVLENQYGKEEKWKPEQADGWAELRRLAGDNE